MEQVTVGQFGQKLLEAAALETTDLAAHLEALAATDPALAAALRQHLSSPEGSFLAVPAAELLAPPELEASEEAEDSAIPPGMTLISERYALGSCLGEGGMGRVFDAFDLTLQRRVALKLLTRDDPALAQRLLREARDQARVHHDHVLEVYDTGRIDGRRPYIAMRYVSGGTLAEVAERLSLEQRVRLLIQAAEGLDAAHREGLIHRDVKPSNILVEEMEDGELRAYVTDFGIAFSPGDGDGEGILAGTPSYLAPEMLAGPGTVIDRRADVYSLGATLYELFTGHRPFEGEDALAVLAHRRRGEPPPPPRQRQPALPVELEAVILRCMAEKPDGRYPTARAVADDLRRFLAGEVVEAYAATLAYRLTRFTLRHRLLVTLAAVAILAILAGSIATAFFAMRAEKERRLAQQRRHQAEGLVHFMVGDLRDKLQSVGRLDLLEDVHAKAMQYFAAVPAGELTDAELARQSQALYQIGDVRIRRGELAAAEAPLQQSLALARALAERHPDNDQFLFDLGQSYFWLGSLAWKRTDFAGALPSFQSYYEISRRLTEKDPTNKDWQLELSYAHSNLGSVLEGKGDLQTALEHYQKSLEIAERLARNEPDDLDLRFELAGNYNTVGVAQQTLGRLGEAAANLKKEVELRRSLTSAQPDNHRYRELMATSLDYLAAVLIAQGDWAAAGTAAREALALCEQLAARDPGNADWQYKLAWSHLWLADVLYATGDRAAAAAESRRAVAILADSPDASHIKWRRSLAVAHYGLGTALAAAAPDEAAAEARTAVEMLQTLAGEQPEDRRIGRWLGKSLVLSGRLLQMRGDETGARALWQQAVELLKPWVRDTRDGDLLAPWAEALLRLGRDGEARPALATLDAQGYVDPDLAALRRAR